MQELVDDLARQRLDRPALALGEPAEPALGLRQLGRADRLGVLAQRRDRRHDVERCLPLPEPRRLGRDDRLRSLGLPAATGEALGDDRLQVVDVVEEAALELGDGRLDVARNGEVDQEQRRAPPAAEPRSTCVARDHEPGALVEETTTSARASSSADPSSGSGSLPEPLRELGRPVGRAVGDERDVGAAGDQVAGRELSDLAGADDQDPPAVELAEHLLSQRGGGGRDRRRALADRRLDAGLAPGVQRAAEQPIEHRARRLRPRTRRAPGRGSRPRPGTIESSPAATRKRCSAAASSLQPVQVRAERALRPAARASAMHRRLSSAPTT